jgi:transmembrane sensor
VFASNFKRCHLNPNFYHINDDMLAKYLLNETTEKESEAVKEWINSEATNRQYYEHFKLIWEKSRNGTAAGEVDEEAAWQRFRNRIQNPRENKSIIRKLLPAQWSRIAALFILIAGAGIFGYIIFVTKPVKNLVVASYQEPVTDTLPDGSVVTLNKNSTLNYPSKFTGSTRIISLQGEAFFNVSPNKAKPFIIHVNDVSISVVGTSFNVRSKNGITEVIVETGIVQVSSKNKTMVLRPSEKIKIDQRDSVMVKETVEDKLYKYYRSKEFVCDDTPLWKLVEVLNEAYNANIAIENKELRGLRLTTTFNNESLDHIIVVISETFPGIIVEKSNDHIILK